MGEEDENLYKNRDNVQGLVSSITLTCFKTTKSTYPDLLVQILVLLAQILDLLAQIRRGADHNSLCTFFQSPGKG